MGGALGEDTACGLWEENLEWALRGARTITSGINGRHDIPSAKP
jgi:hypothetical protein